MTPEELAGFVCQTLDAAGIRVTLTGGACVAIWSRGRYVSNDLDFIEEGPVPPRKLDAALRSIGFVKAGRRYAHPETPFYVEFPPGPLMVGNERVDDAAERDAGTGRLRLLTPTDCVKDRLAAFFHWDDRQALEQAALVATCESIDLSQVRRWAADEQVGDGPAKLAEFERRLPWPYRGR